MANQFPNSNGIRLLVVEPNRLTCASLVNALARTGRFERVFGRTTIAAARRAAIMNVAHVALVSREIREGDERASDLVQFFAALPRPIRSLLIADEWHRTAVIHAFSHGAKGIVTLPGADIQTLSKAVACVESGQVWANSEQLNQTLDYFAKRALKSRREAHAKSSLSTREQEISRLLAKGASNREIANELHISERTVKNHLGKIFEKIGVSSRVQAALRLVG
jgi:DNA-binding NarL/FixJ family response regulator